MKAKGAKAKRLRAWVLPILGKTGAPWRFYPAYYTRNMIVADIQRTTVYKKPENAVQLAARAEKVWVTIGPKCRPPAKPKARRSK